jgi:hypothetical protein
MAIQLPAGNYGVNAPQTSTAKKTTTPSYAGSPASASSNTGISFSAGSNFGVNLPAAKQTAPAPVQPQAQTPVKAQTPVPATPNPLLPTKTTTPTVTSPAQSATPEAKQAATNSAQIQDLDGQIALASKQAQLKALNDQLTGGAAAPTAPNLTSDYQTLRDQQGISKIEDHISSIEQQKMQLQNQLDQEQTQIRSEGGVTQGFYTGYVSEEGRIIQQKLDKLNVDETLANQNLTNKNAYISQVMSLKNTDFANATQQFNSTFDHNYQTQTLLSNETDQAKKDASTYLATVQQMISTSGVDWSTMSSSMKNSIEQAEMQAGWTPGTLEAFAKAKPGSNLLATIDNGNQTTSFVYADANGMPGIVKTVNAGKLSSVQAGLTQAGDTTESLGEQLVSGNIAPSELSKRTTGSSSYNAVLQAADDYSMATTGKHYNIAQADRDYKFAQRPQTQDTLNYLKSLVGTTDQSGNLSGGNLDELQNISNSIGRTSFPALNDAQKWAALGTGDPRYAQFQAVAIEVSDQVAKILQGGTSGGTSDAKLQQAANLFNIGFTKDQLSAVITSLKPLLANRAKSMIGDNPYLSDYSQDFGFSSVPFTSDSGATYDISGVNFSSGSQPAQTPSSTQTLPSNANWGVNF